MGQAKDFIAAVRSSDLSKKFAATKQISDYVGALTRIAFMVVILYGAIKAIPAVWDWRSSEPTPIDMFMSWFTVATLSLFILFCAVCTVVLYLSVFGLTREIIAAALIDYLRLDGSSTGRGRARKIAIYTAVVLACLPLSGMATTLLHISIFEPVTKEYEQNAAAENQRLIMLENQLNVLERLLDRIEHQPNSQNSAPEEKRSK